MVRKEGPEKEFLVVKDIEKGSVWVINPTGAKIIELCDGKHTVKEIIDIICKSFEQTNYETVEKDVWEFIKKLSEFGIIE